MPADHFTPNRLNLRRYLLTTIVPIVLLSISLSFYLYDQIHLYKATRQEIQGVQAIRHLFQGLTELQQIRGLTQIALWGHSEVNRDLEKLQQQFTACFHDQAWLQETADSSLKKESEDLCRRASRLFQLDLNNTEALDLFARYSRLISEIIRLMQITADRSGLILDPELETYYLIDILVKQIPYLTESIGRMRGLGSGFLSKGTITREESERLHSAQSVIRARIENIRDEQAILLKVAPTLTREMQLLPPAFSRTMETLFNQCRIMEGKQAGSWMSPQHFFQLSTQQIDLLTSPYQGGIILLTASLRRRQTRHLLHGAVIFFGTGIAILLMLYFNRSFYLKNRSLQQELAELSVTDQLTGLYNRRYLYTVFPREQRSALRHREHLYLVILDVDNFKQYNDLYGHPAGDQVLQQIAELMNDTLQRAGDYCFRIGGEEFCFLFCEKKLEKAEKLVERVRSGIEELAIFHTGNPPYGVVTVSQGLAKVPSVPDCSPDEILSRADQGLYAAKKAGKNRVIVVG